MCVIVHSIMYNAFIFYNGHFPWGFYAVERRFPIEYIVILLKYSSFINLYQIYFQHNYIKKLTLFIEFFFLIEIKILFKKKLIIFNFVFIKNITYIRLY